MTSVLKKHSPSPPLDTSSTVMPSSSSTSTSSHSINSCCGCKLCILRSISPKTKITDYPEIVNNYKNADKDLEDLIYSLIMLIVDGRQFGTNNPNFHANILIDDLMKKVLNLNHMAQNSSSSSDNNKFLIPMRKNSMTKSKSIIQNNQQDFLGKNDINTQCRIASKIKEKIEKCIQEHLGSEITQPQPSLLAKNFVKSDKVLETEETLQDHHYYQTEPVSVQNSIFCNIEKKKLAQRNSPDLLNSDLPNVSAQNTIYDNNKSHNIDFSNNTDKIANNNTKFYLKNSIQNFSTSQKSVSTSTHIVVNVYLLPECCFNVYEDFLLETSDLQSNFELLESWTVGMITNQKNEQNKTKLLTLNELFQAIKSYLHFSQISSWINQSKGQQPKNIAYSVNCSITKENYNYNDSNSETSTLANVQKEHFDFQTFPILNLLLAHNKFYINSNNQNLQNLSSKNIEVSLLSRKRTQNNNNQPKIKCLNQYHQSKESDENNLYNKTSMNNDNNIVKNGSNFHRNNPLSNVISQPISIGTSLKLPQDSDRQNSNKHFLLPHWSSVMTSPHVNNHQADCENNEVSQDIICNPLPTSDIKSSLSITPDTTPVQTSTLQNLLIPQSNFKFISPAPGSLNLYQTTQLPLYNKENNNQNLSNSPITTPTSFPNTKNFPICPSEYENKVNNHQSGTVTDNKNHFVISQSPKVLVSNHELVNDLCCITQDKLSIDNNDSDYSISMNNKRKFNHEIDSVTQPDLHGIKFESNESECKFENDKDNKSSDKNNNITVINTHITGDLHSGALTTSVTIRSSNDDEEISSPSSSSITHESQHLTQYANVNNNTCSLNINTFNEFSKSNNQPVLVNHHNKYSSTNDNNNFIEKNDNNNYTNCNLNKSEDGFLNSYYDFNNNNVELDTTTPHSPLMFNNYEQDIMIKQRKITKFIEFNPNPNIEFDNRSNLPLSSSPAPLRKSGSSLFDFDNSLKNPRSIRNALSSNLLNNSKSDETKNNETDESHNNTNHPTSYKLKQKTSSFYTDYMNSFKTFNMQLSYSNSANLYPMPITPKNLLGSFEESLLNGRMNPVGVVDGFYAEIGASGSFFPEHATIPVHAAFYQVCEDVAASPYLGVINLASIGKRGYKVPNKGTIQVTLFNPNNTVVKMFVVMYDLSDMPPGNRTFLRQRTMYVPLIGNSSSSTSSNGNNGKPVLRSNGQSKTVNNSQIDEVDDDQIELKSYLRYLIHLRFATSKSGKLYLHTNIKLIFARNKCEIDPRLAKYEYKTFTEAPKNPRYSPKK